MFPLKPIVQIKNLEVALPLVAPGTILVVENRPTQVMNLLLLQMTPRGNSKVLVKMVETGAEAGVVVEMVVAEVVVAAVPTTSTVKLAKQTPTRRSIKAGAVTMATPSSRLSKLPL
jgi:hypothetical protein